MDTLPATCTIMEDEIPPLREVEPLQTPPFNFGPLLPEQAETMVAILRRNLRPYYDSGAVFAAIERRLAAFWECYQQPGHRFIAVSLKGCNQLIGGAGVGALAGLPQTEGIGEVRDLVVDPIYRGQGIGAKLLQFCLMEAKLMGYRQLYLETTPQMEHAQRLFRRFGFKPVTLKHRKIEGIDTIGGVPSYFVLDSVS